MVTMLSVRVVAESELPALVATFPEAGAAPANRHVERFARQLNGEITCLAAWEDGLPVGYLFLRWPGSPDSTVHARSLACVELGDLSVAEHARGRGAGTLLLEAAETIARSRGHNLIGLEVTVDNPFNEAARALYHRQGYRDAGLGIFSSGYTYWDAAGQPHRDEEPHRYMTKRLRI
jgi:GNAT superfamily N-acetyltransferase